jgi:aminoglycoside/choline kinase family phosphotransferase
LGNKNNIVQEFNEENLRKLFSQTFKEEVAEFTALPFSGSERRYFRMKSLNRSVIGAFNKDVKENIAFLTFSKHFGERSLNVPSLFAFELDQGIYLLQDLGDVNLFSLLFEGEKRIPVSDNIIGYYKQVLKELIRFQLEGGENLDYSVCYPRQSFDKQSMQWDLNYFKYYFLKLKDIPFDEQKLENDFAALMDYLLLAPADYFMYRDFQARNVMIYQDTPWFIDYQGGRKGPLQYDLASMLFQAKADLPFMLRNELLDFYLDELEEKIKVERNDFKEFYSGFVLIRTLQVLGAYGFRGYFQRKPHFIESIAYAMKNVKWLINSSIIPVRLPELERVMKIMVEQSIKK